MTWVLILAGVLGLALLAFSIVSPSWSSLGSLALLGGAIYVFFRTGGASYIKVGKHDWQNLKLLVSILAVGFAVLFIAARIIDVPVPPSSSPSISGPDIRDPATWFDDDDPYNLFSDQ